jgi:PKD repeat protein
VYNRNPLAPIAVLVAATLLALGCGDSVAPERHDLGGPVLVVTGQQPAIQGSGTLGTGSATAGSDRQEFNFDVKQDLTGQLFYRDWYLSATLTVDPMDPGTRITAFQDGSSACAAPANGAEFNAIGRRETGALQGFTVIACDDGAAGSGADYLLLTTVAGGDAGHLSSGDIVKTVTEASPTTGDLTITTATAGSGIPAGYTFSASGPGGAATDQPIGANGTVTFTGVAPGDYSVTLNGIPTNCTLANGTNPRTVTVPAGGTGSTTFSVSCVATPSTTGDLTIATATTGQGIPAGYSLSATKPDGTSETRTFTATQSQTFTGIDAGDYRLTITDIPANCALVSGTNPRTVNVPGGGAVSTTFSVNCTAPNQPPVANFTFSCNGLTCNFTSTSSDPDGSITAYSWTFGDGGTSTAQNPSHSYAAGGTYTVKLTVTDNRGATASASNSATVTQPNRAPTVNAGADETVLVALPYVAYASFSDPDNGPWSYTFNWGDGASTSGTKSSQGQFSEGHKYLLPGSYTIRVTVTDSRGASGSDTKVLTVLTPLPGLP